MRYVKALGDVHVDWNVQLGVEVSAVCVDQIDLEILIGCISKEEALDFW